MTQKLLSAFVTVLSLSGLVACGAGSDSDTAATFGAAKKARVQGCSVKYTSDVASWDRNKFASRCQQGFRRYSGSSAVLGARTPSPSQSSGTDSGIALSLQENTTNLQLHQKFCSAMAAITEGRAQASSYGVTLEEARLNLWCPAQISFAAKNSDPAVTLLISVDEQATTGCASGACGEPTSRRGR